MASSHDCARFESVAALRAALAGYGFDAPLDVNSFHLVSDLFAALVKANEKGERLERRTDRMQVALFTAEQTAQPLRQEHARLTTENNALHAEIVRKAEATDLARRADEKEARAAHDRARDLAFLATQLKGKLEMAETENASLREAVSRSYEVNAVVLPSGHEVRWHGRKEHMVAHSPVPPPHGRGTASARVTSAERAPSSVAANGERLVPASEPARLVRAAEAQLTALLKRVEAAESRARELEAALSHAKQQVSSRDSEVARLSAQLAQVLEAGAPAEARRVEQQSASAAIAQLSGQVDFLNAQRAELEAALDAEAKASHEARMDGEERSRYLQTIAALRQEKDVAYQRLQHAAKLTAALGIARPEALEPFG